MGRRLPVSPGIPVSFLHESSRRAVHTRPDQVGGHVGPPTGRSGDGIHVVLFEELHDDIRLEAHHFFRPAW